MRCYLGVALCVASPVFAQTSSPIGAVVATRTAQIGSVLATPGATVFAGDRLLTRRGSGLIVQSGPYQFSFHENTAARLVLRPGGIAVDLEAGAVTVSSEGAERSLEVFASDLRIAPNPQAAFIADVFIAGDCEVLVNNRRGEVRVFRLNESQQVPEGSGASVNPVYPVEPRPAGLDVTDNTFHRTHAHRTCPVGPQVVAGRPAWFWPIAIAAIGGGAGAGLAARRGGGDQRDPVSPTRP